MFLQATLLFEFRKSKTPDYCLQLVFFGEMIHEWFG